MDEPVNNRPNALPRTIEWVGALDGCVRLIDQTKLPGELMTLDCHDPETVWEAIKQLRVRGAPAIGIAAAMGLVLGVRDHPGDDSSGFVHRVGEVCDYLASSRPTAVNLFWALDRMRRLVDQAGGADVASIQAALLNEAKTIRDEDAAMCHSIGRHGEALISEGASVLTHCNAGSLATAEYGTALAPMYVAHELGRRFRVFADETRPLMQGSRLTAWELGRAGIDVTVLCDSMVGSLMSAGKVDLVITGADRIAANGDVANKIGTYSVAVLAEAHGVPFYVAAPSSTFDLAIENGDVIPIEHRDPDEIRSGIVGPTAPAGVSCHNPAFDVTPARLIRAIITERGLIEPVNAAQIAHALR
jgi:methylthioribose-1-phosphate isomerase